MGSTGSAGSRCTGHCCARFFLPCSMEELQADLAKLRAGEKPRFQSDELEKVAEMVIFLDVEERPNYGPNGKAFFYTCKFHDAATGDCKNYENRPRMCSDYPYGRTCTYADCAWEDARLGKVTDPAERLRLPVVPA